MSALANVYSPIGITPVRGRGPFLFDALGNKYMDFTSGVGVLSLGHSHPDFLKVIKKQSKRLCHCSNVFFIEQQENLSAMFSKKTPFDKVFFCNSGCEAMECAFKAMWLYWHKRSCDKKKILCFQNCFHGRTYLTVYASSGVYKTGCGPILDFFDFLPRNISLEEITEKITDDVGAIVIEPVQGEGGVYPFSHSFLKGLRKIANEKECLLIYDEVQCGMGRTGQILDFLWEPDCCPDIVAIAKGMGGGYPVGACLFKEKISFSFGRGSHGSTFGGNPLAMSVASVVFDRISSKSFMGNVQQMGLLMKDNLLLLKNQYPNYIAAVRGRGLMLGLVLKDVHVHVVLSLLQERGVIALKARDNVLRLLPPLNITKRNVDIFTNALDSCLSFLKKGGRVATFN